jgi:hypothetical protein
VRPYDLLHHPTGPPALLALAAGAGAATAVLALTRLSHIAWDRAVGHALRAPDGSPRVRVA